MIVVVADGVFEQDMKQLNDLIDLVEDRLSGMEKMVLDHEKGTIASLDASIEAAKLQQERLKDVLDRIPAHVPQITSKGGPTPGEGGGQESQRKQHTTIERRYIVFLPLHIVGNGRRVQCSCVAIRVSAGIGVLKR